MGAAMKKYVAREPIDQNAELTAYEIETVSGGASVLMGHNEQVLAHYHPITSVETSPYRFPGKKKP
jgi:hypothetical protein